MFLMREISLILTVVGTLILFVVPVRLSIADSTKTDWDKVFPNWRRWLIIGIVLIVLAVSLPLSDRIMAGLLYTILNVSIF
jgi:hypothetical protein